MTGHPSESPPDAPPAVAVIANSATPYRIHLHRRISSELPQIRLFSVFTHDASNAPWQLSLESQIRPVAFGAGEEAIKQDRLVRAPHEWRKGGRIIRWIEQNDIRAVVMLGYADPGRLRILRWCARHGVPVLLCGDSNIHGDTARGLRRVVKTLVLRRVLRWCDAILPCGSLGVQYFQKYGASPDRMFLMPVEPDYRLILELDQQKIEQVRDRFALPPQRRRVIYSGRLTAEKRVDLLIDAFSRIASDRPDWDLLIVGDGPLRKELEQRVPGSLRGRVIWTGFLNDQQTIAALYRTSDLLVLPSDSEPWALVINEAAAAGLAIVASDVVGAAAELVRDGVNGRIFRRGNLERLSQCLLEVTSPLRIDQMKRSSAGILLQWREKADPVQGLHQALVACEVLERDGG